MYRYTQDAICVGYIIYTKNALSYIISEVLCIFHVVLLFWPISLFVVFIATPITKII